MTFTPALPVRCPATTEVSFDYNISSFGTGEWMAPDDPNNRGNYINNIDLSTALAFNNNTSIFGLRYDYFNTEPGYDYLTISAVGGLFQYTGAPINGWYDFYTDQTALHQPSLYFHSDESVSYPGIAIGRAHVCSSSTVPNGTPYVIQSTPVTRYAGVLLAANDVVYFQFPVGSTKVGDQCSSAHDTFALWGDASTGNDFDLYVRCGALPTPTQYDYRSYSSSTQEFVHATTASCPCGSSWMVAVSSFSGSGYFNLVNHKHYASEHRSVANIRAESDYNTAQMASVQAEMTRGFRHFFGANEGTRFWDSYNLQDRTTGSGEIRIHSGTGRPNSDRCGSGCGGLFADCNANLFDNWYDGPTLSHEMGHHYNCLWDEYEDSKGTECGHSIMGSQFYTNSNYCFCVNHPGGVNKCSLHYGDHGWDPTPANLTSLQTGTAWLNLASRAPYSLGAGGSPITLTPDNYDYTNFSFGGIYAVPVVTNH